MKKLTPLVLLLCFFSVTASSVINLAKGFGDQRPKIRIGFDSPQIDHRQILLTIDENSTDGVDWGYDAEIYEVLNDDMYWIINQKKYVIQATNNISVGKEISLGIITTKGGTINIGVDSIENPIKGIRIGLLDKELNIVYDIQNVKYKITLPAGEYHNRFALTFLNTDTNLNEINTDNIKIIGSEHDKDVDCSNAKSINKQLSLYVNNSDKTLKVKNEQLITLNSLILFNDLGQITKIWKHNLNSKNFSLPIDIKQGLYILQANTEYGKITKRILVKSL